MRLSSVLAMAFVLMAALMLSGCGGGGGNGSGNGNGDGGGYGGDTPAAAPADESTDQSGQAGQQAAQKTPEGEGESTGSVSETTKQQAKDAGDELAKTGESVKQAASDGARSASEQLESAGEQAASAAGGQSSEPDAEAKTEAEASDTQANADAARRDGDDEATVDTTVRITGNDQMQYNIDAFTVKPGARVRINFEHVGKQPKSAMGHNVVVTEQGTEPTAFAGECISAGGTPQNDYLPDKESIQSRVIAATEMVGGGESTSVTFTVPSETGDYPFVCTFPAHVASGMKGTMKVRQ